MSKMVNSLLIMENSARILSILSMKKLFITEAIVSGETYLGIFILQEMSFNTRKYFNKYLK